MTGYRFLPLVAVSLAVVGVAYFLGATYLTDPLEAENANLARRVADLRAKNNRMDSIRARRDDLQRELEAAQARYAEVEQLLPSEENWAGIFEDIKSEARQASLTLVNFDNQHQPYPPGIVESPLKLEVQGRFASHLALLNRLRNSPQVIFFREADITVLPDGNTTMSLVGAVPINVKRSTAAKGGK